MNNVFNSTFEISLRVLLILDEYENFHHHPINCEMAAILDFIAVYGKSFGICDTSLHGDSLFRFCEFPARRQIVEESLKMLVYKGLVTVNFKCTGFTYSLTQKGIRYCRLLESDYAYALRNVAQKSLEFTKGFSEKALREMIKKCSIKSLQEGGN